jgi:effector-binding domain-containing protein
VELDDLVERHVASVCTSVERHRLRHTIGVLHELVMDAVGEQGLAPAGPLFTRYHRLGEIVTLEAGIPLAQPIEPLGVVAAGTLPGGPALRARHVGGREQMPQRCPELQRYCSIHGLRQAGPPWECYLVDGRDTPDEREWVTEVYLPVRSIGPRTLATRSGRRSSGRVTLPRNRSIGYAVRP